LKAIRDYPNPAYVRLLNRYAADGLEITVYVQAVEASPETLSIVQEIGASSVILYEKDLLALFMAAGIESIWWSGVALPSNHPDRPQYQGWPDLRTEQVRQDIADWAVQVPHTDGGLALDYIRWNRVGDGRTSEQVTDLVRRIRENWDKAGDGALSAAVYPYLSQNPDDWGAQSVGQQWDEWLGSGLVDWVYPMAYDSNDIPDLVVGWENYDRQKIIPCLSPIHFAH